MVRIIEKSPSGVNREDRISKLIKIAKDLYPGIKILTNSVCLEASFGTNSDVDMVVSPDYNMICVFRKIYLEKAVKLAGEYERSGEEEFSVKKNY